MTDPSLWVSADPVGHTFDETATVHLIAERSATIHYTLDSSPATQAGALTYDAKTPLELVDNTLVMFVAVDEQGRWSKPRSEFYLRRQSPVNAQPLQRALVLQPRSLYFGPRPGEAWRDLQIMMTSRGESSVRVTDIRIEPNADGLAFYEEDAFELLTPLESGLDLAPGEHHEVTIRYVTTLTLRSAALVIQTNGQRTPDGQHRVTMWGRLDE